jgi:hypothetical protein
MELLKLQQDPAAFRDALLIDTDAGPRPLREVQDDWQRRDFEALDSGWVRAVLGAKQQATTQRGWLERPRGHSKSLDLAIQAAWALFASRRRLSGIAAAGDVDQARLLRDAVGRLVYVNAWLSGLLEIQNLRVINRHTGSSFDIISSDAPTSYGLTPDFEVIDELTHWKKRDLWDSLISSAAKRSTCMVVVITNAGLSDDWQWQVREAIRNDSRWYFSRLEGPVASWITQDRLDEQRRLLPDIAFGRLWLNEWTSGSADWISQELLDRAFAQDARPHGSAVPGYDYVCGIDLGVSRNWSAIVVLAVNRGHAGHGTIQLAAVRIWRPMKEKRVNLQEVEDALADLHDTFDLKQVCFDPWQATHMASRLQAGGFGRMRPAAEAKPWGRRRATLPMVEVPPTMQNLQRQATVLIEGFNDQRVQLYYEPDLRLQLNRLRIEERGSGTGFRLVSPQAPDGSHGDVASAFALAMVAAADLAQRRQVVIGNLLGPAPCGDDRSARFEAERDEFSRKQQAYQQEMAALHASHNEGGYREGFLNALRGMTFPFQ